MQLLSVPYSCALVSRHYIPVPSISFRSSCSLNPFSQCRLSEGSLCCFNSRTKLREARRVYAQSQERVENETLNVTDLRDVSESSDSPAEESWQGGLSEEEAREALNFEQGGGEAGPSVEEAKEAAGGGEGGPSVEEAKEAAGVYERTINIPLNRGKGAILADIFMIFGGLLDRPFGSGSMIAAAGSAVIEKVSEEIENIKLEDGVNEQLLFEVIRVMRLLEMDLKLVSASQKESTLLERLDVAKKHCREAVLLVNEL